MSTMVDPKFMAFLVDVERAFVEALKKHDIEHHAPIGFEVSTIDGVAARFYEDGIELYPADTTKEK